MTDNPNVSVTRNDGAGRYEIAAGDAAPVTDDAAPLTDDAATPTKVAGYTAFQESETHIAFTHTELDDAYQGQGLASQLAAYALADAVSRSLVIIPLCPYIERYLRRHPMEGARIEWPNRAPRT